MKTKLLALAAAILPILSGCANSNAEPEATNATMNPPPAATTNVALVAQPVAVPEAEVPVGQPVNTELTTPDNVKLSPAAAEIAKLAQAGVDSSVMLAYVTNSIHTFNLASDEIVYLNDIGLPPAVVTAMIQHDQQIREASLAGATATSPATPGNAQSVWAGGQVVDNSNTWQQTVAEPAPAAEAEAVPTAPPPPPDEQPSQVTVNYFYDSLTPYGTWIDIAGYGRCWRPTIVATYPGWRPYCNGGRWMWTDDGWYWYSDYSWGWAPFHYGRWFSHPRWGWCWMPGSIWGPAWVSWRYSDAYCGWAPLPPAAYYSPGFGFTYYGSSCGIGFSFGLGWNFYTFVSYHNFRGHHYDRYCAPHHEAQHIYDRTHVANNIIRGNNHRIINQGIAPDRIAAATGTPVQTVRLEEIRGPHGTGHIRHEQLGPNGSSLTVVRANVPTGNGHQVAGGANPPARGGAQGLTMGNASHDAQSNPPERTTRGPRQTVPPRTGGSPTAPALVQSPTAAATGVPANVRGPAREPRVTTPSPATGDEKTPRGALVIRSPRSPRTTSVPAATPPATVGNTASQPAPAATPVPTTPAAPVTPRDGGTRATPWLNNNLQTSAQNESAAPQPQDSRTWQVPQPTRNANPIQNQRPTTPPVRQSTPTYSAPAAPQPTPTPSAPRNYVAPSQPTRSYTPPPAQSYSPPPAQSYTPPPTRSYSPPSSPSPRAPSQPSYSAPRSEPSTPSSPSRSSGSSESKGGGGGGGSRRGR